MLSWGLNQNCQLGQGDSEPRIVPQEVKALADKSFTTVQCGSRISIALTVHGNVFTWGRGADGQLGNAGYQQAAIPSLVQALEGKKIVRVATRGSHVLALTDSGLVYSWGRGDSGQLGLGDKRSRSRPHLINGLKKENIFIKEIACGRVHSVVVSNTGDVYSWGCGDEGATGLGNSETVLEPRLIEGLTNVVQVACGSRHTLALTDIKTRQYGTRNTENELYCWGWNAYGQLGLGDNQNRDSPELVTIPLNLRESENFILGDSSSEQENEKIRIIQIACGYRHSMALLEHGSVVKGSPDIDENDSVESKSTELWSWGWNQYGQLGFSSEWNSVMLPSLVEDLPHEVYKVAGGGRHTLAILRRKRDNAKRIYAWGRGDDGQLGTGSVVQSSGPVRTRTAGENIELIAAGWSHSVCVWDSKVEERVSHREHMDKISHRFPSLAFRSFALRKEPKTLYEKIMSNFNWNCSEVFSFGNVDGGFAQILNTIILFLMMLQSLHLRAGFQEELVISRILPGAAATIFVSNIGFGIYGDILGRSLAEGGSNVTPTAIPHGINTVLFFAFTMLIIVPEYHKSGDAQIAYRTGLACSFVLGLLELPCVLFVGIFQEYIPRAAMMSALAGVSLTFISMTFIVQIYSSPLVGILPMFIILVSYGSNIRLPFKMPATLAALGLGAAIVYFLHGMDLDHLVLGDTSSNPVSSNSTLFFPSFAFVDVFTALFDSRTWPYITSVVLPMLLINLVNNVSCVESAVAVGDEYSAKTVLTADALVTIFGALMGNPFPTAVYIGHPAFKAMGATTGYSYINGVVIFIIGMFNGAQWINRIVPQIAGVGLLMWIGIAVTANAFEVEKSHMSAVAFGLLPALASWCLQHVDAVISACSSFLDTSGMIKLPFDEIVDILEKNGVRIYGLISLSNGYLLSSIFLASTLVHIIEREFSSAAMWMFLASFLSFIGAVHSFEIAHGGVVTSYGFPAHGKDEYPLQYAVTYFFSGILLLMFQLRESDATWFELLRMMRSEAPKFEQIGEIRMRMSTSSFDEENEDYPMSETSRLIDDSTRTSYQTTNIP